MGTAAARQSDLLADPTTRRVLFLGPQVTFVAGFLLPGPWRTAIISLSLFVLGGTCLENARRCGRLHCYLTGPFYLAMAAVALALGLGALPAVDWGWLGLGVGVLVGGNLLSWLPEAAWGRYR